MEASSVGVHVQRTDFPLAMMSVVRSDAVVHGETSFFAGSNLAVVRTPRFPRLPTGDLFLDLLLELLMGSSRFAPELAGS